MDEQNYVINFTPIVVELLPYIGAALAAGVGWLIQRGGSWLGFKRDSEILDKLEGLAEKGIDLGMQRARKTVADGDFTKLEVQNQIVADAANYLVNTAPKWKKKTGWTEAQFQQWLEGILDSRNEKSGQK